MWEVDVGTQMRGFIFIFLFRIVHEVMPAGIPGLSNNHIAMQTPDVATLKTAGHHVSTASSSTKAAAAYIACAGGAGIELGRRVALAL